MLVGQQAAASNTKVWLKEEAKTISATHMHAVGSHCLPESALEVNTRLG
jgi:hypothetical protein